MIATALLSGIDTYADDLLSIHMVEHMLLMMVAPVLLAGERRCVWPSPPAARVDAARSQRLFIIASRGSRCGRLLA